MKQAADSVNHPDHYRQHASGVECIQITEHFCFNLGNAIKYIWRSDHKGNALEDLRKAKFYIEREIERRTTAEKKAADAEMKSGFIQFLKRKAAERLQKNTAYESVSGFKQEQSSRIGLKED